MLEKFELYMFKYSNFEQPWNMLLIFSTFDSMKLGIFNNVKELQS